MNKKVIILLVLPFLIGCDLFKPRKDYKSASESLFSYDDSSETTEIPEYYEPHYDENGVASPTDNPHFNVTVDQQPTVIWDNSQANLRSGKKTLDFWNINDLHGIVDETENYSGIRKLSSYLQYRYGENHDGFVFTSSGDSWQGSADSNLTRGVLIDSWLEYVNCSAMALGNHEFDWTIDTLAYNDNHANFPFLACNIVDTSDNVVDWIRPFTTITRNGVNIGIIGAIGEGITSSITASYVRGLTFKDPLPYVKTWSNYLKNNGADVILLLYHNSTEGLSAEYNQYVNGIFGGHNHAYEYNTIGTTPAVQASAYGKGLSHIKLSYDFSSKQVVASFGEFIKSNAIMAFKDDTNTDSLIHSFDAIINDIKNEKVAYLPSGIGGSDLVTLMERYMYRYYVEELGNEKTLYCVRHNQSRQDLNAGYVTYGDIYAAFPFDNALVLTTSNYQYADEHAYTSYYPNGVDPSLLKDENDNVYILTINYLSEHQKYGEYLTEIQTYNGSFPRDVMKKYMGEEYPLP